jgi:hypothetical protein
VICKGKVADAGSWYNKVEFEAALKLIFSKKKQKAPWHKLFLAKHNKLTRSIYEYFNM